MFLALNLYIFIALSRVKVIVGLRRPCFINPTTGSHSYSFHNRLQNSKSNKCKNHLAGLKTSEEYRDSKHFALTKVDKQEPTQDTNLLDFLSLSQYLDRRFLFSEDLSRLSRDELIDRQIEHRRISNESLRNIKMGIAIVLSAFAVGVLYKFSWFLKDFIEQQAQNLASPDQ
ncbi:conserved hypothetical protein [Theileria orientalis strain Shintoku]|uniref:Uncharacterized protein n=1 Tax=Theileria orientalis strain Shintoku TaxID=869250 RepID=J4C3E6_THEOR|nr:conserved hypothetical protein [Theileria orientalis strain Shintoku]PVC51609.1 hypothetical protein MACL_00001391 [Theileria orientalis]BAM40306.1 conserved hypothetical protein [Theileria orientalis strain Shintoku]|eukprot:XP_009690607.1 conserved hypothetical protein [Theileria orientalis strain Shintoku]